MTPIEIITLSITLLLAIAISVTLWQVKQFLSVLTNIKQKELELISEQTETKKEEAATSLPMDALNSDAINWASQTAQINLDDYEIVTPRRAF